jgi:long-chain fatty acid transport protein
LKSSEFNVAAELLHVPTEISSSVTIPGSGTISGTDESDSGIFVLPTVAIAFKPECSRWSYGLGLYAVGGFGFNFPQNIDNPILSQHPLYSRLSIMQLAPTVAYQLTDRLSIGFAPTVSMADAQISPDVFTPSPYATHGRIYWGMGFQVGLYYETDHCWSFGASFKSPQWFEDFRYNKEDTSGVDQKATLKLDYPMVISLGAAYRGIDRLVWAVDVRYVDYNNTDGFGDDTDLEEVGPDVNRFTGLGWKSVFSVATGAQYELTDKLTMRMGYSFNEAPVKDEDTYYNTVSPAIYQHIISVGASYWLTCQTKVSLAYLYSFENEIEGTFYGLDAPVEGTVSNASSAHALIAGLEVRF